MYKSTRETWPLEWALEAWRLWELNLKPVRVGPGGGGRGSAYDASAECNLAAYRHVEGWIEQRPAWVRSLLRHVLDGDPAASYRWQRLGEPRAAALARLGWPGVREPQAAALEAVRAELRVWYREHPFVPPILVAWAD